MAYRKHNKTQRAALIQESMTRAITGQSMMNYAPIIEGFIEKGIPADQISPRENVFTFNIWKQLGRTVKKGEHGVKVVTFVERSEEGKSDGEGQTESKTYRFPKTTTVFHVSQTQPIEEAASTQAAAQ